MQNILREGAWSIFLTVPVVDLNTARVIICSSLMFSGATELNFMLFVSKVENAED